jgi:hypothetical protein
LFLPTKLDFAISLAPPIPGACEQRVGPTNDCNEFCKATLLAILTAQADRDELDERISVLTRSLANEHGIPASYPPTTRLSSKRSMQRLRQFMPHMDGYIWTAWR